MATIPEIISRWVDNDGAAIPFSRLYSYSARSSVPKALYSDVECTIPLANPLVSDASGKFPQFFATSGRYKFALKTAGDVLIDTRDDIEASGNGSVGTVTSVQVTLGAALGAAQHVTTPPVTSNGNINMEFLPQSARYVLIGPTSGTGLPTFRALEAADLPYGRFLPLAGGTMNEAAIVTIPSGTASTVLEGGQNVLSDGTKSIDIDATLFEPWVRITNTPLATVGTYQAQSFRVDSANAYIHGYIQTNADLLVAVDSGAGAARISVSDSLGDTQILSTSITTKSISGGSGATAYAIADSSTNFVGQDFDIRNSKRLLIGGVEAISSARVGSFTGLTSTGGATITGTLTLQRDIVMSSTNNSQLIVPAVSSGNFACGVGVTAGMADIIGHYGAWNTTTLYINTYNNGTTGGAVRLANVVIRGATSLDNKLTLAPAAAGYASLNIPTRSAAVTSPVAGDIENTGSDILLYGLGFRADNFINARATVAGGQNAGYIIKSAGGIDRWAIYKDASTESGSDAGSGLIIRAYDDAGGVIGTVASCGRASGTAFVIGRPLTAQSSITASSFVKSAGRQSAFIARTSAYTALATDEVIGISGTTIFNVLLPATAVVGTQYTIKRTDANTTAHTVTAGGTTTIDGATTFTFSTAWQVLRVIATATNAYSVI